MEITTLQEERGIGNAEAIAAIQTVCPKYNKATHSMVTNRKEYGVRLTLEALKALKKAYPTEEEKRINRALERDKARFPIAARDETGEWDHYICPVCGATIYEIDRFCSSCGQKLAWENV